MRSRFNTASAVAIALWLSVPVAMAQQAADAVLGEWVMQDGSALLAVERDDAGYSVRILSVLEPEFVPSDGDPRGHRRDLHNPEPELRDRPVEGLHLARGVEYRDGAWQGRIYDPGSGNEYRCTFTLDGDFLRVHGYVGVALLGRTVYWQRADRYAGKVRRMLGAG